MLYRRKQGSRLREAKKRLPNADQCNVSWRDCDSCKGWGTLMYAHLHSAQQGSLAAQKHHSILPIAACLCQVSCLSARLSGERLCAMEC